MRSRGPRAARSARLVRRVALHGIPKRTGHDLLSAYMLTQQSARLTCELDALNARRALLEASLEALRFELDRLQPRSDPPGPAPLVAGRPAIAQPDGPIPARAFRMGY